MAWDVDSTHSQATFAVKHMMISTVKGQFDVLSCKVDIDEQHPENSWIEAQVDAASINTRDEKRDVHLRSPDFFDAKKYPTISSMIHNIEPIGYIEYLIIGNLTMHVFTKV